LDFAASSRHEALLEECKRREWRGLITHVSISQNPSRDRSVESGCIKSTREDNLKNFDEETPPKIKETNPKLHEIVLNESEAWTVISKETVVLQPRAKYTVLEKYKKVILEIPPAFFVWNQQMCPLKAYAWPVL
jgi:hypothetical protein